MALIPIDLYPTLFILRIGIFDVDAVFAVYRDTKSTGDIADDIIARNRRTAAGKLHLTVADIFHNDTGL